VVGARAISHAPGGAVALGVGTLTAGLALSASSPWAAAPAVAAGLLLLGLRTVLRIERPAGEARLLVCVHGIEVIRLRRVPLAAARAVTLGRAVNPFSDSPEVAYPVAVDTGRTLLLWTERDPDAALRLATAVAGALALPLLDASDGAGAERVRAPDELAMSLGERLLHRGEPAGGHPLPRGSRLRLRLGPETEILFPPSPPSTLLFGLRAREGALVLGPGHVTARWPLGRARRIPLDRLRELADDGDALVLVTDRERVRLPWRFADPRERDTVRGLIERAALAHQRRRAAGGQPSRPPPVRRLLRPRADHLA